MPGNERVIDLLPVSLDQRLGVRKLLKSEAPFRLGSEGTANRELTDCKIFAVTLSHVEEIVAQPSNPKSCR